MDKKKRFEILKRHGFQCFYCGRKPPEVALEVDHRTSRVVGGEAAEADDNLVAACRDCNRGKGATSDQDDDGIVIVTGPDGHVDHKRSLKLSGLWSLLSAETKTAMVAPIRTPLEVLLRDVDDAERTMQAVALSLRGAHERVFRARAHEQIMGNQSPSNTSSS